MVYCVSRCPHFRGVLIEGLDCMSAPPYTQARYTHIWKYMCIAHWLKNIRESVDSLCRDGEDLPRAPYIGKACTRLNGESLSLFGGLTMVLK